MGRFEKNAIAFIADLGLNTTDIPAYSPKKQFNEPLGSPK
jgi:hypothetical protein